MSIPTNTMDYREIEKSIDGEPGFLEEELDAVDTEGKVLRRGKRTLLKNNQWVEFSVYPKGKRISLDSRLVTSVSEGDEGEAIIAVKSEGQPHILIRLLDLYGPALRAVLLGREW